MKKRILCALTALLLLILCGCGAATPQKSGKLRVVCSLFPYYDFVRQIGGEWVEPILLLPPGREIHSFEPTPMDAVTVSGADIFCYNGGEGEMWADELLESCGDSIGTVVRGMDVVTPYEEEVVEGMQVAPEAEEEDSDEIEYDEHIWTAPQNAMLLCRAIAQALEAADPAHAEDYAANLDGYLATLTALDDEFCDVVANAARHTVVFGDRFPLLYFCREYGLSYRAAFHGCSGDTEPSIATLKYLIDKVEQEEIPVVYTIELSNQRIAQVIAESTGAKVLTFYTCQNISRADFAVGESYVSLMQKNVDALKEGLS
jgi:zinc transport system substrate-binding protein